MALVAVGNNIVANFRHRDMSSPREYPDSLLQISFTRHLCNYVPQHFGNRTYQPSGWLGDVNGCNLLNLPEELDAMPTVFQVTGERFKIVYRFRDARISDHYELVEREWRSLNSTGTYTTETMRKIRNDGTLRYTEYWPCTIDFLGWSMADVELSPGSVEALDAALEQEFLRGVNARAAAADHAERMRPTDNQLHEWVDRDMDRISQGGR